MMTGYANICGTATITVTPTLAHITYDPANNTLNVNPTVDSELGKYTMTYTYSMRNARIPMVISFDVDICTAAPSSATF